MGNVVITNPIPDIARELLEEAGHSVTMLDGLAGAVSNQTEQLANADALLCLLSERIERSLLDALPQLRVVTNYAVGYDNIDTEAATSLGVAVTNTPDVLTQATAELAWALIFAVARRIREGEDMVRSGEFVGWGPLMLRGVGLSGKTLGILGAGRIGQTVGRIGHGLGMPIIYLSRTPKPDFEAEIGARAVSMEDLLREADVISVNLPLNDGTRHLLDAEAFEKMKSTAIVVNTGRGPVIDEAALVDALESEQLFGAGLDVYEHEPDVHPGLLDRDDVVLVPHIGSATVEARNAMAQMAAENILAALNGERPPQLVNRDLPESWRGATA